MIDRTPALSANPQAPGLKSVRPGTFVLIQNPQHIAEHIEDDWWMGQIIWYEGDVSENRVGALVQVANVDDGAAHWVNANAVSLVLHAHDGIGDEQRVDYLFWL